jgi:hypothetical protein
MHTDLKRTRTRAIVVIVHIHVNKTKFVFTIQTRTTAQNYKKSTRYIFSTIQNLYFVSTFQHIPQESKCNYCTIKNTVTTMALWSDERYLTLHIMQLPNKIINRVYNHVISQQSINSFQWTNLSHAQQYYQQLDFPINLLESLL